MQDLGLSLRMNDVAPGDLMQDQLKPLSMIPSLGLCRYA